MIKIVIDNVSYEVEADQNLLQAALSAGLELPYFCWHPAMGSVGACRQCAVTLYQDENDTRGRLGVACMTPVADGMRVSIQNDAETHFREQVISALMTNHPHDCPVCAEGGDCHLQDMTVMTGHFKRQYPGLKRTFENQLLGPFIKHEMNRCITCYRCVRYYRDYAGGDDLAAMASKNHVYFGRHEDGQLESPFAGNLVEVCPTGVFTDKVFGEHFSRKWDLQSAPSVCQHCSVGCNLSIGERYGSLRRVVNRFNSELNGYFLCDRGRFGFHYVNSPKRRRQISVGPQKFNVEWQHPILQQNLKDSKGHQWLAIGSPYASIEDNFALQQMVGETNFAGFSEQETELAAHHLAALSKCGQVSLADIEQADAIIIVGEPIDSTAPRIMLAVQQALTNKAREKAEQLRVPEWQDAAVRQLIPDNKVPLFILGPQDSALSREATLHYRTSVAQCTNMVSALTDSLQGEQANHDEATIAFIDHTLPALKDAKRPLIICGWQSKSANVLEVCSRLAQSLSQEHNKLAVVAPAANSIGLAGLTNQANSPTIESLLNRLDEKTGLILLHGAGNAYLHKGDVKSVLQKAEPLIDMGHFENDITDVAQLRLPVTAFSEQQGTQLNYQGRAQCYSSAVVPPEGLQTIWQWCDELAKPLNKTAFDSLQGIRDRLGEIWPELNSLWASQSNNKTARQSPRFSGRTAQLANQTMHEPKPVQDCESNLSYSMEGLLPGREGDLPYTWSPGWNSNQAIYKFQQGGLPVYPGIEVPGEPTPSSGDAVAEDAEYSLFQYPNFYSADFFSGHAPHITSVQGVAEIEMSASDAEKLEVANSQWVSCQTSAGEALLLLQLSDTLADGCIVVRNANTAGISEPPVIRNANENEVQDFLALQQKHLQENARDKDKMLESLLKQDQRIPIKFVGEVKS